MRFRTIFSIVMLVVLVASFGMSQYAAKELFNYPKGASIDTLMGGAGDGWAGSWYKVVASQKNAMLVSDTAMPYDALAYAVPFAGNCLTSIPDTTGTELRYARNLDKVWPNDSGKVYWISFLMDVKNATDVSTWLGVKFFSGDNGEAGMLGKGHGLDKYTCGSGWHGGVGNEVSTTPWTVGPVWIVGKVVMKGTTVGASQDTIWMWITPDPAAGDPKPATAAAYTAMKFTTGFDRIRIEFGGTIGKGLNWSIDELRLGTSFAEVSNQVYSAVELFNYSKGKSIDTLMGGMKDGWANSWYKVTASQKNAMVVSDTAMPYDALAYAVPNLGNCLTSIPDTTGTELRYARDLDKLWPNDSGKVYWISFLMDVKNATDNSTWLGVKFYNGANGENGMLGKGHGLDKYTCGGGWHGGVGNEVSTTPWTVGPVWLVGKVVMKGTQTGASNDTIWMWITPDPDAGEPKPATAAAYTSFKMANGFDRMRIEFGGTIGKGLNWSMDELRLGTSFADVSSLYGSLVTSVHAPVSLPSKFDLAQNYPNPFNPSSTISYTLTKSGNVRLAVFDLLGREIAVLVNSVQTTGQHQVTFSGERLTSGVYFYRLETAGSSVTKKMVLMK